MFECFLLNHAIKAELLWMKLGTEVNYLEWHKSDFLFGYYVSNARGRSQYTDKTKIDEAHNMNRSRSYCTRLHRFPCPQHTTETQTFLSARQIDINHRPSEADAIAIYAVLPLSLYRRGKTSKLVFDNFNTTILKTRKVVVILMNFPSQQYVLLHTENNVDLSRQIVDISFKQVHENIQHFKTKKYECIALYRTEIQSES